MDPITALGVLNGMNSLVRDDSAKQQNYTLELMAKQSEYNKEAMRDQEAAAMRMFNATGYKAQVEQLKNSGLNPGLIYGMGSSGAGVTGNISAPQVSQGSAPNVSGATAAKAQSIGMALQLGKLESEIAVNKSVAELNKAEATKTAGVDTESEKIKQIGMNIDNRFKEIQAKVAESTSENQINQIVWLSNKAHNEMLKSISELQSAESQAQVDIATINTKIETYNEQLKNVMADTLVKWSNKTVNEEQAKKIVAEVQQKWIELEQQAGQININDRKVRQELQMILINNEAAMDRLLTEKWFDLGGNLIKTISGFKLTKGK